MGSLFEYKKIFIVDSSQRLEGTNENFSFVFRLDNGLNFDKIALQDMIIPRTMYLVRPNLNTFTLTENGVSSTVTVPVGNYSYISFKNSVPALISAASPNGLTYTMTFSVPTTGAQTGKFTFGQSNGAIQSSFTFGLGIAEQMGFDKNSTVQFSGPTLVSVNVVNFAPINVVYLKSSAVRGSNYNQILQEIYLTGPPFSDVYWQNPDIDSSSRDLQTNDQNSYNFSLQDEDFQPIDLNGANFVFTIILYKESIFQKLARAFFLTAQYWLAKVTGSIDPVWPGEAPDNGNV